MLLRAPSAALFVLLFLRSSPALLVLHPLLGWLSASSSVMASSALLSSPRSAIKRFHAPVAQFVGKALWAVLRARRIAPHETALLGEQVVRQQVVPPGS